MFGKTYKLQNERELPRKVIPFLALKKAKKLIQKMEKYLSKDILELQKRHFPFSIRRDFKYLLTGGTR